MNVNSISPNGSLAMESFAEQDLLNSLPDGAYITDVNRKILFWNRAAERITGPDRNYRSRAYAR